MRYPETTSEKIYRHHSRWVPYSAAKADRIIAVSNQTKNDIVELLGIPDYKIDVVYSAADERFQPLEPSLYQPILSKYNLPDQFILFVGTIEPRKNLIGLLKAYLHYKLNSDHPQKLVIVGAKGWKYSPIFAWIEQHQLHIDVIFTGFIEDDDLVSIYNGASVFVMPSIYEGFGIPILEAMGCGKPVIGSNVSSIPEVIGNSGILVPPDDYERLAQEIYEITSKEEKQTYYSRLSLERARHFDWKKTAAETKKVYDKIL
jgi:glycosyltransferase involved in cell wall biosynthesis